MCHLTAVFPYWSSICCYKWVLKSSTIVTVDFLFCGCYPLPFILLCSYVGCIYTYSCYIFFLDWSLDHYIVSLSPVTAFILKFILCDMSIATLAVFCFLFAWNTFFYSLTFILYEFRELKWVSCKQHIYGSWFYIHSASLSLLAGAFNLHF